MTKKLFIRLISALLLLCFTNASHSEEVHREAPPGTLISLNDSQPLNYLQQFKGKVVYVDFWASWCGPCAKSFPFMNDLDRDLKSKGLQVIGVNLDENIEDAKQFLTEQPANFIIGTDSNQECAKKFDVKAMPSSYLINKNGVIKQIHLGFRPDEALEFRTLVEQLLAENPTVHH